jgi:hypothetical protein
MTSRRSDQYRQEAERAHSRAERALTPQERDMLLEIERNFQRLELLRNNMDRIRRRQNNERSN